MQREDSKQRIMIAQGYAREQNRWKERMESRRRKRIMRIRKKIGGYIMGIGFLTFVIGAAAIDGPGNDMRIVYTIIASGLTELVFGGIIGDYLQ